MNRLPVNPLQSIIAKAATALPATTGAVERHAEQVRRAQRTVLLADVSGSMASSAWGGRAKHELLVEAVQAAVANTHCDVVTFAGSADRLPAGAAVPPPAGGTSLDLGLVEAMRDRPGRILVISDGEPDDEGLALTAAARFDGRIDVLYIGPDSNAAAMKFLRSLARHGRGTFHESDVARATAAPLTHTVHQLLLAPSR